MNEEVVHLTTPLETSDVASESLRTGSPMRLRTRTRGRMDFPEFVGPVRDVPVLMVHHGLSHELMRREEQGASVIVEVTGIGTTKETPGRDQ
jgi:hypothetical protein